MAAKQQAGAVLAPEEIPRELSFLHSAQQALAEANTIDDIKQIHEQAEAARVYAKAAAMGLEIQNQVTIIKIHSERKMGDLLKDMNLRGGNRKSKKKMNLEDFGITKKQSSRFQTEAAVPEEMFEAYVNLCVDQQQEVTSAALLRMGKALQKQGTERCPTQWLEGLSTVSEGLATALTQGKRYGCIYVNPAWPDGNVVSERRQTQPGAREFAEQLRQLQVKDVAAERSHLHMQTTCVSLREALSVIQKWGFTYKGALMLPRRRSSFSFGKYWQTSCDLLILGVRGNLGFRDSGLSGWMDNADGTSEREVMEQLVRVSPGPRLEMFACAGRSGWDTIQGRPQ